MNKILKEKLSKISKVFDIEELQKIENDGNYIQSYYQKNKIPYFIFHTRKNFVHMGISRDGVFKEEDLLEHAVFVEKYLSKQNATDVLELATGRGANSLWLAERHPRVNFYGIDFSRTQLSFAQKAAKKVSNFHVKLGDFHHLKDFKENTFDIVFIVEALCYSNSTEKVVNEVKRVLKDGGYFIIFDGYLSNKELSSDENTAVKITSQGMSVAEFLKYTDFRDIMVKNSFTLVEEKNVSAYVTPTMQRFERLAEKFFSKPRIGKFITWILPQEFTHNSVSGMLMPVLFEKGVFEYWITVFQKDKNA